jgi:hypothetical protein
MSPAARERVDEHGGEGCGQGALAVRRAWMWRRASGGLVDQERAGLVRGVAERVVPRCEQDVVGVDGQRGGEVHGVVAAQRMPGSEVSGVTCQRFVDADDPQLRANVLERIDGEVVSGLIDPRDLQGGRDPRARLWVDELARDRRCAAVPQFRGKIGAGLLEDQLDQRRGVEVDDQRR